MPDSDQKPKGTKGQDGQADKLAMRLHPAFSEKVAAPFVIIGFLLLPIVALIIIGIVTTYNLTEERALIYIWEYWVGVVIGCGLVLLVNMSRRGNK